MSDPGVTAKARKFYERFPFPGRRPVDRDGLMFLRRFTESIQSAQTATGGRLRVLDAGCGTGNTSLSLARHFPAADFVGIDHSRTSVARAREAAALQALPNLVYRSWNLLKPLPRSERYDIILCLGVLHHTADMRRVLLNLRRALAPRGVLYLWIYGRHGRYRHTLNVRLLSIFLRTNPVPSDAVAFAREFMANAANGALLTDLPGAPPAGSMQSSVYDDPAWIADQFLNPHERLVDMEELLSLISSSGFSVDRFLGLNEDPAELLSPPLGERFHKLPRSRQLVALDLILKPERYFVLLRKSRKRS